MVLLLLLFEDKGEEVVFLSFDENVLLKKPLLKGEGDGDAILIISLRDNSNSKQI